MEEEKKCCGDCKCPHHKIVPWCIILIGLSFLLSQMNILTVGAVNMLWPVFLIIIGVVKLRGGNCKCCHINK
jgi:hypothetical protein